MIQRASGHRCWYVVLNGHRARIVQDLLRPSEAEHVETVIDGPDRTLRDTLSDRPTRGHASAGSSRSAVEPGTDPLAEDERRFLRDVYDHLDRAHRDGDFDEIVVIGPAKIIGLWRDTLPGTLAPFVKREIVRNLVPLSKQELRDALRALEQA